MNIAVTLVERDYLLGACVLYNSLVRNGFEGFYVIGYRNRGSLPAIALRGLEKMGSQIELMELNPPLHFANYKPAFMQQVLERFPECTKITYFDPDIVINSPCNWIFSWCEGGPSVCADVNWWMPSEHPTRRQWIEMTGITPHNKLQLYFNSGFLSLLREDYEILELWWQLIKSYGSTNNPLDGKGSIGKWRKGGRWLPFMSPDQDTLNIALMGWEGPITTLGPDEMGFSSPGGMPHATGPKPWHRRYITEVLFGRPPRQVDKLYWSYADSPLPVASKIKRLQKRIELSVASFIARFYHK